MELLFEKFSGTNARLDDRISITVNRAFGFTKKYFDDNKLSNFKYVVLFYDKKNMAIGFQFINDEKEPHKFTLIRSKQGYGASVVATSFFKTYNLEPKKFRGKYPWKRKNMPEIGRLFIIYLKDKEVAKKEPS